MTKTREINFLAMRVRRYFIEHTGNVFAMPVIYKLLELIDEHQPIDSIKVGGTD